MKFRIKEISLKDDLITTATKVVSDGHMAWILKTTLVRFHYMRIFLFTDYVIK